MLKDEEAKGPKKEKGRCVELQWEEWAYLTLEP